MVRTVVRIVDPARRTGCLAWAEVPESLRFLGAGNRIRTDDIQLGKLTLYQLSYARRTSAGVARMAGPVKHRDACLAAAWGLWKRGGVIKMADVERKR